MIEKALATDDGSCVAAQTLLQTLEQMRESLKAARVRLCTAERQAWYYEKAVESVEGALRALGVSAEP